MLPRHKMRILDKQVNDHGALSVRGITFFSLYQATAENDDKY